MYRLNPNEELTAAKVLKYIEHNRKEVARRQKLYDYYVGKHAIADKSYSDPTKPCNKISNAFPSYITDVATAYFLGNAVQYRSEDTALEEAYRDICAYNDEPAENMTLGKNVSIYGESYELLWVDIDGNIRFKSLDPICGIPIYDNTLEEELIYFIRYWDELDIETDNTITYVDVYTNSDIRHYRKSAAGLDLLNNEPHIFGACPVIVYRNDEGLGDYERVISLIDAYDDVLSGEQDDLDYMTDAYLAIYGVEGTTEEDVANLRSGRIMSLPADAKAEWLVKNVNDAHQSNIKNVISNNIFAFSGVPNMSDENFAANASGVAIRYKLLSLETKTAKKEANFRKGLTRRIELICLYLGVLGSNYDFRNVEMIFTRDIPTNLSEQADIINKIGHLLSEETQLSLLPIDVDYKSEQERKAAEDAAGYADIDFSGDAE